MFEYFRAKQMVSVEKMDTMSKVVSLIARVAHSCGREFVNYYLFVPFGTCFLTIKVIQQHVYIKLGLTNPTTSYNNYCSNELNMTNNRA